MSFVITFNLTTYSHVSSLSTNCMSAKKEEITFEQLSFRKFSIFSESSTARTKSNHHLDRVPACDWNFIRIFISIYMKGKWVSLWVRESTTNDLARSLRAPEAHRTFVFVYDDVLFLVESYIVLCCSLLSIRSERSSHACLCIYDGRGSYDGKGWNFVLFMFMYFM